MILKKKLLQNSSLYVILDRQVNCYDKLFDIAKKCVQSGVKIIQLRDKFGDPKEILSFSKKIRPIVNRRAVYIVNDRVDLALVSKAGGVHLGQNDLPIKEARKIVGKNLIIGASCQNYAQALKAQKEGADYLGFGSVFKTLTKPDREPMDLKLLKKVSDQIKIPVFAIGGISLKNAGMLRDLDVKRWAICRDICKALDVRKQIGKYENKLV